MGTKNNIMTLFLQSGSKIPIIPLKRTDSLYIKILDMYIRFQSNRGVTDSGGRTLILDCYDKFYLYPYEAQIKFCLRKLYNLQHTTPAVLRPLIWVQKNSPQKPF